MSAKSAGPPIEIIVQGLRLGQGKAFVFRCPAITGLADQAGLLLDAVSKVVVDLGGWLVDDMLRASKRKGFAALMEDRARGQLGWETVCPRARQHLEGAPLHKLAMRVPYTMLSTLGYPCWGLDKHLYTIDLFNPANELMLPYEDEEHRYWAIHTYPPSFLMPDATFAAVLGAAANALDVDYGFGGRWLAQAIYAYRFAAWSDNNYLKPLDPSVRLTDLSYPYMLLRSRDLPPDVIERLRGEAFSVRRPGLPEVMATCELLGPGNEYVFLRLGPSYPDPDEDVAVAVAAVLGRPYAKTAIVSEEDGRHR